MRIFQRCSSYSVLEQLEEIIMSKFRLLSWVSLLIIASMLRAPGPPIPNLVTEIPSVENGSISEDQRTITLKLRDDIVWSDGTPITSADFKFTYDMLMADGNAVASRSPYDLVESFETPDER